MVCFHMQEMVRFHMQEMVCFHLQEIDVYVVFKSQLKTFLFSEYFS